MLDRAWRVARLAARRVAGTPRLSGHDLDEWAGDLLAHVRPGDTVVEVGAGGGAITYPLARRVGPSGRIVVVEPRPDVCKALRAGLLANGLDNVTVVGGDVTVDAVCREHALKPDGLRIGTAAPLMTLEGAGAIRRSASPWLWLSLPPSLAMPEREALLELLAADGASVRSFPADPLGAEALAWAQVVSRPRVQAYPEWREGGGTEWIPAGDHACYLGDQAIGWGLLERWRGVRLPFAEPIAVPNAPATRLYVHSTVHEHYEAEKGPHALAEAQDLVVDFSRLHPARTLRFRPRYKKGDGRQYHRYRDGALAGTCRLTPDFHLDRFPREHLRDIFASFRASPTPTAYDEIVEHPVLFVTREGEESRNVFHATTDLLNALETVLILDGVDRADLEVVFLDNAPPAPFDRAWPRLFSPTRGVRRVADFGGRRVLFRRALFSPPGYHSPFFAHVRSQNLVPGRVGLLDAFSAFVRRAHGVSCAAPVATAPLRVTLVVRRPYDTHEYMGRRLANEEACVAALQALHEVDVRVVDFARHPFEAQIRIAAETDILVGVHGGGLTHLLWMPPYGGVLEVDAASGGGWRCFRNLACWTGREFEGIAEQERSIAGGTEVHVDTQRLAHHAAMLAARVRARRAAADGTP